MEVHDLEEEEGTHQDRGGCVSQGVILHPQCGMHAATPRPGEGGGQSGFDALAGRGRTWTGQKLARWKAESRGRRPERPRRLFPY